MHREQQSAFDYGEICDIVHVNVIGGRGGKISEDRDRVEVELAKLKPTGAAARGL